MVDEPRPSLAARGRVATVSASTFDWMAAKTLGARPLALVSGFWRSGTTWMLESMGEALKAKTIFEPLSPRNKHWDRYLLSAGITDRSLREAFIPGPQGQDSPFWRYVERSFFGQATSSYMLLCRGSIRESLKAHLLVKDVRAQFNLGAIHQRHNMPVIHVRRHPCAVAASLKHSQWDWNFGQLRLSELFDAQYGQRARPLRRLLKRIEPFDTDAFSRVIAYWAVTERAVARQVCGQAWALLVLYEQAIADPAALFRAASPLLGVSLAPPGNVRRPSIMSNAATKSTPPAQKSVAWKDSLTEDEKRRAEEIVRRLYPEISGQYFAAD